MNTRSFRQNNAWLHTWTGLLLGWLLFAVFFTGTLSFFQQEISFWMKPELHRSVAREDSGERAFEAMKTLAPNAGQWQISLPGERQPVLGLRWFEPGERVRRNGGQSLTLDASTLETLEPRETRGGAFLYRFHFELYGLPREGARWIVAIATMVMLIAIVTGVITHKKIFKDFFTFRPRKGQRSWLDAHNALAVLALPFHLMITYSGLLLFMFMLMPWGIESAYQGDRDAYIAEGGSGRGGGGGGNAQPTAPQASVTPADGRAGPRERPPERTPRNRGDNAAQDGDRTGGMESGGGNRREARGGDGGTGREGGRRGRQQQQPATLTDIAPLLAQARAAWPAGVGSINVVDPGTTQAVINLQERGGQSLINRGSPRRMSFNGVTGEALPGEPERAVTTPGAVSNVLTSLHLLRFADAPLRWLMFISGVLGTLMAATGLILWVVKRLPERRKLGHTPFGHRLVETLNVGTIAGLTVATAGYFWANRLLPADLAQRADWEIRAFFTVWAICLLHPLLRSHRRAWLEQLGLGALLLAALPLWSLITSDAHLLSNLIAGRWLLVGMDTTLLVFAALLLLACRHLRTSGARQPAPRRRDTAATDTRRQEESA